MSAPARAAAIAAPSAGTPSAFGDALRAIAALGRRFALWREQRARAAEDRAVLAGMSERDLLDIGISRSSVDAVADRKWMREYPC